MGLASEMKNLSEELLSSFKNRIKENTELVIEVQKTLDGFRKDHMELAAVLHANAASLRKGLARGEKERLNTYNEMMSGIHHTIGSIQKEVVAIQASTLGMINEFSNDRAVMAEGLNKFFAHGKSDRMKNEKSRMKEFDALMKNINLDIKSINEEVAAVFLNTNNLLAKFEKEHADMSEGLRAELGKNLAERVEYTNKLLNGFQKRLLEMGKENQKMAHKLRKDLDNGEVERLEEYAGIMKGIHVAIKGIRTEVKNIKHSTDAMLDDLLKNRVQASAEWNKMHEAMAKIRKNGHDAPAKETRKAEKKEVKTETAVKAVKEHRTRKEPVAAATEEPKTLEQKVLGYISKHPKGVRVAEMEGPLGETRMKLGFTAKTLLDAGKVQKVDNIYFPVK